MDTTTKALSELTGLLMMHSTVKEPAAAFALARKLRTSGRAMMRAAEQECNTGETIKTRMAWARNQAKFTALATAAGLGVYISGDPRGYVAHVIFPDAADKTKSVRFNTLGGAECGWGVTA